MKNPILSKVLQMLPQDLKWRLKKGYRSFKNLFINQHYPLPARFEANQHLTKGITLIGYNQAATGIGQAIRSHAKSLEICQVPFDILNIEDSSLKEKDLTWQHKEVKDPVYNINVFHINADSTPKSYKILGDDIWQGRYNIGVWAWELPEFPDEWMDSFGYLNEVWVSSDFILDAVKQKSPIPVVKIPYSIELDQALEFDRKHFQLPNKTFLFLSMYDVHSIQERKNPMGAIKAFTSAFKPDDTHVGLVIKINHADANIREVSKLKKQIEPYQNIYLIEGTLERAEINSLINVVDCFVSLHRSEGFGLVIAEAMYLAKPVIATNWSGNTDFMNQDNACGVSYTLKKLEKAYGPYAKNQIWAEPNIQEAAAYMQKLSANEAYYHKIATKGQKTIQNHYSPEVVGRLIKERIDIINEVITHESTNKSTD